MRQFRLKLRNYIWWLLNPSLATHLGDFSAEQLQLAGLQVSSTNEGRQGGTNVNPGTDSETDDLRRRAAEDADLLGRDDSSNESGDDEGEGAADEEQQQARPNHTEAVARATAVGAVQRTTAEMSFSKMLSVIPGFEEAAVTKTMFLCCFSAPGGVHVATPRLNSVCGGLEWTYNEVPGAFDADFLVEEIAAVPGNNHVRAHLRNDIEAFLNSNSSLARVHNAVTGRVSVVFPEKSEPFLFNPLTRDRTNNVYTRIAVGGRTVFMTACWQLRSEPIHRPLDQPQLSEAEQLAHAARYFPGIANRLAGMFGAAGGPGPVNGAGGGPVNAGGGPVPVNAGDADAALMQNLLQRMQAQEQQLQQQQTAMQQQQQQAQQEQERQRRRFEETTAAVRRQYEGALDRYRTQMQQQVTQATARVVGGFHGMSEADVKAMSHEEFQRRLDAAIAELTTGPPPQDPHLANGVPVAAGVARAPRVVTVESDTESSIHSRMSALTTLG